MVTDTLEATAFQAIEVRCVRPDPEQPRKTFDEEALQELARSLSSNGLLQPIVVRPDPEGNAVYSSSRLVTHCLLLMGLPLSDELVWGKVG